MIKFIYSLFGWCYHEYSEWTFIEGKSLGPHNIYNGRTIHERVCQKCKWHDRKTRYY